MYSGIRRYIKEWEGRCYNNGIPDEAPVRLEELGRVPSYRMIVYAIIKNDVCLELLGFSKPKCKIYSDLKRIELLDKGKIKPDPQLKLKL